MPRDPAATTASSSVAVLPTKPAPNGAPRRRIRLFDHGRLTDRLVVERRGADWLIIGYAYGESKLARVSPPLPLPADLLAAL